MAKEKINSGAREYVAPRSIEVKIEMAGLLCQSADFGTDGYGGLPGSGEEQNG